MSSSVADAIAPAQVRAADAALPRLGLLGTGTVGRAFVARYQVLQQRRAGLPAFAWLANSRILQECRQAPAQALVVANAAARGDGRRAPQPADLRGGDIVVDATASEAV
ncbi:homoserine dehydrogenase, partial [Xanthomonas translucens DAR61454]